MSHADKLVEAIEKERERQIMSRSNERVEQGMRIMAAAENTIEQSARLIKISQPLREGRGRRHRPDCTCSVHLLDRNE